MLANREDDVAYQRDMKAQQLIGDAYSSEEVECGRSWEIWNGGGWESNPVEMHEEIYADYTDNMNNIPGYDQPILLVTAGAGGVGKTTALNEYLNRLKDPESVQSSELKEFGGIAAEGLRSGSFLALSHDDIKRQMCARGAVNFIKPWKEEIEQELDNPTEKHGENRDVFDRPDMLSASIHRESSWVMDHIAYDCLKQKKNLVYGIALTDAGRVMSDEYRNGLFDYARQFGYQVIAMTVEGSQDQALEGNYKNYLESGKRLSQGDRYGITVNPEGAVKYAYPAETRESVCRKNVQEIADTGRIQRVIRVDYGFPSDMRLQNPKNPEVLRQRDLAQQNALATFPITDRAALFQAGAEPHNRGRTPSASDAGRPRIPSPSPAKPPVTGRGR